MNGKYNTSVSKMPRLYALISQVEAGGFKENHISYNPSRTSGWDKDFRTKVILEHSKLQEMSPEVAEFFCLKEIAELEEYGMEYCTVRSEDNSHNVEFGIGIDGIKMDHGEDEIQRYVMYSVSIFLNVLHTYTGKFSNPDRYSLGAADNCISILWELI